ncbi:Uma2 family endonuclease [Microcoleus sp. FACHB-831]|uniref:Uma2 family endonuclease n=1 Tax=Microcoleus sp. FACHB-831 TaxID=2692827 RepID=UPI001685C1AA|nr:Uma2 family endonuclease [Microcoleus sp. FACHB-831]MBD1920364.1 Uma2 family endonuclease [Microcoleus sp. FACHB-831]
MTQALPKPIAFEGFLEWKPEPGRYELHDGVIIEIQPTGEHEEVKGFLATKLTIEFDRLNVPYFIPNQALVKPPEKESGYLPDVLILNRTNLAAEPLWKKYSTVTQGASIPLVIEVVRTNWRDDYLLKVADYEEIGVPEYWIFDYLGLGGRRFIGNPKQPTISVYSMVEGEYQVSQFRGSDSASADSFASRIESPAFPELNLTVEQIFRIGALPQ